MTRGQLKSVYDRIGEDEKKEWSRLAEYSSYHGLFKYLTTKQDTLATEKIINTLISVIGQTRYEKFAAGRDIEKASTEDHKNLLIKDILGTNDPELIKRLGEEVVTACNNQLGRLKIMEGV